jgi:hypothetical protein
MCGAEFAERGLGKVSATSPREHAQSGPQISGDGGIQVAAEPHRELNELPGAACTLKTAQRRHRTNRRIGGVMSAPNETLQVAACMSGGTAGGGSAKANAKKRRQAAAAAQAKPQKSKPSRVAGPGVSSEATKKNVCSEQAKQPVVLRDGVFATPASPQMYDLTAADEDGADAETDYFPEIVPEVSENPPGEEATTFEELVEAAASSIRKAAASAIQGAWREHNDRQFGGEVEPSPEERGRRANVRECTHAEWERSVREMRVRQAKSRVSVPKGGWVKFPTLTAGAGDPNGGWVKFPTLAPNQGAEVESSAGAVE